MTRLKAASFAMSAMIAGGLAFTAIAQPPATPPKNDYFKVENWLCRPDKADGACHADQDITVVKADGSLTKQPFVAAKNPAYDCFYVYPTASEDPTPNSDMIPGRETLVATNQFGRFASLCRPFAPMYRSVTLGALRANTARAADPSLPAPAVIPNLNYNDVVDAWNYYLQHDNKGRGVVLVGHSQGSGLILRLIQSEIEGKPIQKQIISAIIPGSTVQLPVGKDVGGTFKSTPVCTKPAQVGCVIVYGTYRSNIPPSVTPPARFGRARDGNVAACVNTAALGGGKVMMDSIQAKGTIEWSKGKTIDTPFVRTPGLITGECVTHGEYSYLEVTVNADPADPRSDVIGGDIMAAGKPDPTWGMHNADLPLSMGNVLAVVDGQAKAWLKANPGKR